MNSVIGLEDILENFARMWITGSPIFRRDTSNTIRISFSNKLIVADIGSVSSGNAELKFQSSSPADVFCAFEDGPDAVVPRSTKELGVAEAWLG